MESLDTKSALRKYYKDLRMQLSAAEESALNQQLLAQFQQFIWDGISYLHIYLPIKRYKEPNTMVLGEWLRSTHEEMHLVISKSDLKSNTMDHYLWEKDHLLELNQWGIYEPQGGEIILAHQLDAVIIPLLAFDKVGNRIGYGKGFYDRFLAACRPDCLKIGISFFEPVHHITDVDPTDIPLDFCITPERVWDFN